MPVDKFGNSKRDKDDDNVDSQVSVNVSNLVKKTGDVITGILDMSNNKITNLALPTESSDVTNKQYVDTNFLTDQIHQPINMNGNKITNIPVPTAGHDVVNKTYVDSNFLGTSAAAGIVHFNADINMNDNTIQNVHAPNGNHDAVNKHYVDTNFLMLNSGSQIITSPLTLSTAVDVEDTITMLGGQLDMNRRKIINVPLPSNNYDAVNKLYADLSLSKSGGTLDGDLDMNSNRIFNVADPNDDFDAANKSYVDTQISTLRQLINQLQRQT